jgi:hypothetical protein
MLRYEFKTGIDLMLAKRLSIAKEYPFRINNI